MKKLFLPIILLFIGTSCSHYVYIPNSVNVPLLKEKDEIHLSGSLGTGEHTGTTEAQASFAATKHIGILANYMNWHGGSSTDGVKANYFDVAAGYFLPLGNLAVFEVYAGGGGCQQHHVFPPSYSSKTWDLSYQKLYIQPSIGLSEEIYDLAFSTRIANLVFTNLATDPAGAQTLVIKNENILLIEPALTFRMGWKYIKAQIQLVTTFDNGYYTNTFNAFERFNLNAGIFFSLAPRHLKN